MAMLVDVSVNHLVDASGNNLVTADEGVVIANTGNYSLTGTAATINSGTGLTAILMPMGCM